MYLALQKAQQTNSRWSGGLSNQAHKEAVKNETTKAVPVLFNYLSFFQLVSVHLLLKRL